MRRLTAAATAVVLVLVTVPIAAAARRGTITGKVVDGATGRPVAGARITLTAGTPTGRQFTRGTTTGRDGTYRFGRLPAGGNRFFAIDARYDGGLFAGRTLQIPADTENSPVIRTKITVWETTSDPTAILLRRDDLFVVPDKDEGGIGVIESVLIVNRSREAYVGRGDGANRATLGFALPPDATGISIVDSDLDIPEIVPTDFGFGTTVAIPPGSTRLTFSYRMPSSGGTFDLSRPALYPTLELTVYASDPLEVASNRLADAGVQQIGEDEYRAYSTDDDIDAGDETQLVVTAAADPRALTVPLTLGAAAVATLLAAWTIARGRRRRRAGAGLQGPGLVEEIARLDLAYEAGDLDRESYLRRRGDLKERLRAGAPR